MSKRTESNRVEKRVEKRVEEPVEEGAEVEAHRLEKERSRVERDGRIEEGERSRRRTEK